MESTEFIELLKDQGEQFTYDNHIIDTNVWFFREKLNVQDIAKTYHEFKILVGRSLNVSAANIAIVGSAKTGFSMNPNKNLKAFDGTSDIDLVIVSPDLFRALWDIYLRYVNESAVGQKYAPVAKNIFRHFVTIKERDLEGVMLVYFKDWQERLGILKRDLQLKYPFPDDINFRIYDDWKFVEKYHVQGLQELLKTHTNNGENQ